MRCAIVTRFADRAERIIRAGRTPLHEPRHQTGHHGLQTLGEPAACDLTLEHTGSVLRVQIKSTKYERGNSYKCYVSANGVPYRHGQADFIAAYVITACSQAAERRKNAAHGVSRASGASSHPSRRSRKYNSFAFRGSCVSMVILICPHSSRTSRLHFPRTHRDEFAFTTRAISAGA